MTRLHTWSTHSRRACAKVRSELGSEADGVRAFAFGDCFDEVLGLTPLMRVLIPHAMTSDVKVAAIQPRRRWRSRCLAVCQSCDCPALWADAWRSTRGCPQRWIPIAWLRAAVRPNGPAGSHQRSALWLGGCWDQGPYRPGPPETRSSLACGELQPTGEAQHFPLAGSC